jgi:[ribosomal protein S18]-alanine N-acetyltransferase
MMKSLRPPLVFKPMQEEHIAAVMEIERASFSAPWPDYAYRHEITENRLAHYYVLCPAAAHDQVWGYVGFWLIVDEAHISTIAVSPALRRQRLGQRLLLHSLDAAATLGASRATLEVRESNRAAQSLYLSFGFVAVGKRKGYYTDNHEDAIILTTPDFDDDDYRQMLERKRAMIEAEG